MENTGKRLTRKLKETLDRRLREGYLNERKEAADYNSFTADIEKASPVKIRYDRYACYGYYKRAGKEIIIESGQDEGDTMKSFIRGITQAICVKQDQNRKNGEKKRWTVKRLEAASISYMAGSYFGLDMEGHLFPNIVEWGKGMDRNELFSSMEFIYLTAENLINSIAENMPGWQRAEIKKEYREDIEDLYKLIKEAANVMEKPKEEYQEQPLHFQYYVLNTAEMMEEEQICQRFSDLDPALDAYAALPNHLDKQLGMESMEQELTKMVLLNCINGCDEIGDIWEELPNMKWLCNETGEAYEAAQSYVENHETEIAYRMEKGYFSIQTISGGYDYTIYDEDFKEVDGGIYDCPNVSVRDAMWNILFAEDKHAKNCYAIDYDEFQEKVESIAQDELRKAREEILADTSMDPPGNDKAAEDYAEYIEQYLEKELGRVKPVENPQTKPEKNIDHAEPPKAGKRQSVLEALRKHQSKLKEKKQEKPGQVRNTHKKGLAR